jgi:intein/homing endonuclease
MCIDSKAIYYLLKDVFEIPKGKKSHILKVPKYILLSNKSIKAAFLIGIMTTEGGKRKRGYLGLSTASKQMWKDLSNLFSELKIKNFKDKWTHRKYQKEYYGIAFKPQNLEIIMRSCRSGQTGQILVDHFHNLL